MNIHDIVIVRSCLPTVSTRETLPHRLQTLQLKSETITISIVLLSVRVCTMSAQPKLQSSVRVHGTGRNS